MDTTEIVVRAMEEVLELDYDELIEDLGSDLDLIENDILDSLSIVSLLTQISDSIGYTLDIKRMKPEDFITISSIVAAVAAQRP